MPNVLVIVGSVRPNRVGLKIGEWVAKLARQQVPNANFEVIDLKDYPMALDDEPGLPYKGPNYTQEVTRKWSAKVSEAHGFVFVSSQYNFGYSAALKNAIDHLYHEWTKKPALILAYGPLSGEQTVSQLRGVLECIYMKPIPEAPQLHMSNAISDANNGEIDPAAEFAKQESEVLAALQSLGKTL